LSVYVPWVRKDIREVVVPLKLTDGTLVRVDKGSNDPQGAVVLFDMLRFVRQTALRLDIMGLNLIGLDLSDPVSI